MRALVLAATVLAATGCLVPHAPPPLTDDGPSKDVAVHTLKLERSPKTASPWTLSQDKGHVVLLDVWATWCDPCRDSLPLYADLQKQYGPKGLKVYAVNIDADSAVVPPFLEGLKVELPVLLDPEARASESVLKVKVMPTSFLIDRQGRVRQVHEGFADEFLGRTIQEVEGLLAEPP